MSSISKTPTRRETKTVAKAFDKIMKKAKVPYQTVTGGCIGKALKILGFPTEAKAAAEKFAKVVKDSKAKILVVANPAAYDALVHDYKEFGIKLSAKVMHTSEYLRTLKLKFKKAGELYYLESDFLKNYNDNCKFPRALLADLKAEIKPFGTNNEESYTCGEGAVVLPKICEGIVEKLAKYIEERADDPKKDLLVVASPYTKIFLTQIHEAQRENARRARGGTHLTRRRFFMALVNMKEMLIQARREKRAVGAFNIANYETAAAVLKAAEAEKSPVIIQLYMRLFNSNKAYDLAGMLIRLAHRSSQPVALHLDHGDNVGQVKDALAWGYTSVMYDGSRLPFDENVRITHFCVEYAKTFGASVEGEIGHVAQGDETALTDVGEACEFARQDRGGCPRRLHRNGARILQIHAEARHRTLPGDRRKSAGNAAGASRRLRNAAGGYPENHSGRIAKINIATEFMDTYLKATRKELNELDGKFIPIDKFYDPIIDECAAHAARLIRFFAGK